jgi:hypothetical protein
MIKSLFIVLLSLIVTGCAGNPDKPDIIKTKTIVVSIPAELISTCKVTKPPKVDEYVNGDYLTKEDLLIKYSINLLNDLTLCNNSLYAIQDWNAKQLNIYKDIKE